jgi:Na+-driven multidrug efflux pump
MKFGKLLIQGAAVFLFIVAFSLAGAITPQFTNLSSLIDVPADFLLYLVTVVVLTAMGYFLGIGIQSVKKSLESLGLAYGGSLVIGGVLALMTLLKFPYSVQLNLYWIGTTWYDPWLLIFFVGTPIMLTFVVC